MATLKREVFIRWRSLGVFI